MKTYLCILSLLILSLSAIGCATFGDRVDIAIRNDFHIAVNPAVSWNDEQIGLTWELAALHWSPIPFVSAGAGFGIGKLSKDKRGEDDWWIGFTTYAGVLFPFSEEVKIFADGLAEIGYDKQGGVLKPVSGLSINPGWDIGLRFAISDTPFVIEAKYRSVWHQNQQFTNSIGVNCVWNFWE